VKEENAVGANVRTCSRFTTTIVQRHEGFALHIA